jgi:hypothetical protein
LGESSNPAAHPTKQSAKLTTDNNTESAIPLKTRSEFEPSLVHRLNKIALAMPATGLPAKVSKRIKVTASLELAAKHASRKFKIAGAAITKKIHGQKKRFLEVFCEDVIPVFISIPCPQCGQ